MNHKNRFGTGSDHFPEEDLTILEIEDLDLEEDEAGKDVTENGNTGDAGIEIEDLDAALEEELEREVRRAKQDAMFQEPVSEHAPGFVSEPASEPVSETAWETTSETEWGQSHQTVKEMEAEVDEFLARLHGKTDEKKKSFGKKDRKNGGESGSNGNKSSSKKLLIAAGALAAAVLTAGGVYAGMAQKYKTVYFPNTQINGVDASGMTVAEVKDLISAGTRDYVLTIEERGGKEEKIAGAEIGLHPEFNGALEQLLAAQNPYTWGLYQMNLRSDVHALEAMIVYDEAELGTQITELDCLKPENQTEPENARISDYVSGQGYSMIPETDGTAILEDVLKEAVASGIVNLQERISLEEEGAYKMASVTAENPALLERLETMNRYAGVQVTYQFGDKTEVLDGDRIHQWIAINNAGQAVIDSGEVIRFVEELAIEYNTANKAKTLKTSYGKTVKVSGGSYGWRINQSAEADALAEIIRSGESQSREPIYGQKAASHGENDYGDTYVEINLTAQHLFFYKDGKKIVESDFVSGNESKGWGTPAGTYPLTYKQKDATLKGEDYETPVDFWMPFNGGIGMHDATWRSSFGGTIYKTGGSHGCINLPHSAAKKIYENISAGVPVICYNLSGTEKGSTSAKAPEETKASEETTAAEETTKAPTESQTEAETKAPAETAERPTVKPTESQTEAETKAPEETAERPTVKPTESQTEAGTKAPAETAERPTVKPTESQAGAETTASSPSGESPAGSSVSPGTTGGPGSGSGSSENSGSGPASAR